jgi:hypothetical protein
VLPSLPELLFKVSLCSISKLTNSTDSLSVFLLLHSSYLASVTFNTFLVRKLPITKGLLCPQGWEAAMSGDMVPRRRRAIGFASGCCSSRNNNNYCLSLASLRRFPSPSPNSSTLLLQGLFVIMHILSVLIFIPL